MEPASRPDVPGKGPVLVPTGDITTIVNLGVRLQAAATEHNIHNVFDDGGYKELLLLTLFNLKKLSRTGDDAVDYRGRPYEIKTVARVNSSGVRKPSLSVTTEHTLTVDNVRRYRDVFLWIVAVFDQAHPEAIYEIAPLHLEPYFNSWEERLRHQDLLRVDGGAPVHLNNPKIPMSFIEKHGIRVWPSGPVELPAKIEEALAHTEKLIDSSRAGHDDGDGDLP
jgi:hypothetical protein